jgi:hypothetical protein
MKKLLLTTTIGCAFFTTILHAQILPGGGGGAGGVVGDQQSSGEFSQHNGQQEEKTASADAITGIAPPYDVDDVLRMHRVGLQDEVIINALRGRYHPLVLTDEERNKLHTHGVSEEVVYALEDPYDIGIENVRSAAKVAAGDGPQVAPRQPAQEKTPSLKRRSEDKPAIEPTAASKVKAPSPGTTEEGVSHPPADNVPLTAKLDIPNSQRSAAPPPTRMVVNHPSDPGVYIRRRSAWERIEAEPIAWSHKKDDPTKNVEGTVPKVVSSTVTFPGEGDFLVIVKANTSVIQYQLLHLHEKDGNRVFKPAKSGATYTTAGVGDLMSFNPERLGPSSWLVSLRELPAGDYGFLPPIDSQLKSTTDLSSTLYTFHLK